MPEKLPVFATIGEAFELLEANGRRLLLPGVLIALLGTVEQGMISTMGLGSAHPETARFLYLVPVMLLYFVFSLPFLTSAHRSVLQGERGRTGLGFDHEEWLFFLSMLRLIGVALLIGVILAVIIGVITAILIAGNTGQTAALSAVSGITIVMYAAMGLVVCRYMLILPAAAIGEWLTLGAAGRLLKGNLWRLFFALAIIWVAASLVRLIAALLGSDLWIVQAILLGVVYAISTALTAFILSLAYRRLAMFYATPDGPALVRRDPPDLTAPEHPG
jgi:hypothetical protein